MNFTGAKLMKLMLMTAATAGRRGSCHAWICGRKLQKAALEVSDCRFWVLKMRQCNSLIVCLSQ